MTALLPHERPDLPAGARAQARRLADAIPVIQTERLTLRPPRIEDFPAYARIATGPAGRFLTDEVTREGAWLDFAQMTATWLLRGHGVWTVTARGEDMVLGFVLIGFEPGDHEPELGFLLLPEAEGQGFAAEAARAARAHAFGALGLETLVSTIDPDNARSCSLAERLGGVRDRAAEAAPGDAIRVYRYAKTTGAAP